MKRLALPPRLQSGAIERINHTWIVWLHTADYKNGTYLELHSDGAVYRITEQDDVVQRADMVMPCDTERNEHA